MLSVRSRGRDWVCDARGTGIKTVVQTNTADGLGWVCCAVLLLRDVKCVDKAGRKLPTLLVFCTLRSGWPLPAPLTLRARKGLLYVRARVCACSLAQVGVVERRRGRQRRAENASGGEREGW